MPEQLHLLVRPELYAVCRLEPDFPWDKLPEPPPVGGSVPTPLYSATRSDTELSLICEESRVPLDADIEFGWRALTIDGQLEFDLIGVLAGVTSCIAQASVSVFAVSTFDTDHIFVRQEDLASTVQAVRSGGYTVAA